MVGRSHTRSVNRDGTAGNQTSCCGLRSSSPKENKKIDDADRVFDNDLGHCVGLAAQLVYGLEPLLCRTARVTAVVHLDDVPGEALLGIHRVNIITKDIVPECFLVGTRFWRDRW